MLGGLDGVSANFCNPQPISTPKAAKACKLSVNSVKSVDSANSLHSKTLSPVNSEPRQRGGRRLVGVGHLATRGWENFKAEQSRRELEVVLSTTHRRVPCTKSSTTRSCLTSLHARSVRSPEDRDSRTSLGRRLLLSSHGLRASRLRCLCELCTKLAMLVVWACAYFNDERFKRLCQMRVPSLPTSQLLYTILFFQDCSVLPFRALLPKKMQHGPLGLMQLSGATGGFCVNQ